MTPRQQRDTFGVDGRASCDTFNGIATSLTGRQANGHSHIGGGVWLREGEFQMARGPQAASGR